MPTHRMAFDEIVCNPLEAVEAILVLADLLVALVKLDQPPGDQGRRARHRKPEFDVIASIVPPAFEVDSIVSAIARRRIAAPFHALAIREGAGPLRLVYIGRWWCTRARV